MTDRDRSLTILGVVRNGGAGLEATLHRIDDLRHRLHQSACIIATNDNADDTNDQLMAFAKRNSSATVLRLDGLVHSHPQRVERIAVARNITLATMWQQSRQPHTLVLDLDGPNANLPGDHILALIDSADTNTWDALFANQTAGYYDLYALRHPQWCPQDPWLEIRRRRRQALNLRSKKRLVAHLIHDRQYAIAATHPRIPVLSAFGGLALYKTSALEGAWYSARDACGQLVCEHVILHQAMVAAGMRLFIDPALLNEPPPEHLGPTSGRPFPGFHDGESTPATGQ